MSDGGINENSVGDDGMSHNSTSDSAMSHNSTGDGGVSDDVASLTSPLQPRLFSGNCISSTSGGDMSHTSTSDGDVSHTSTFSASPR
jgi:hypothetical protein